MTIREAITLFGYHQKSDLKARTVQSYHPLLKRFEARCADRPFDSIGWDEIYQFLESLTEKLSKSTRRLRYAQLKAFCNFLIEKCNWNLRNPCDAPLLAKAFKTSRQVARRIKECEPHLIILNHNLPGANVSRLCEKIKAENGKASTQILILAESDEKVSLETARALGADDRVYKPIPVHILEMRVDGLLKGKREK